MSREKNWITAPAKLLGLERDGLVFSFALEARFWLLVVPQQVFHEFSCPGIVKVLYVRSHEKVQITEINNNV